MLSAHSAGEYSDDDSSSASSSSSDSEAEVAAAMRPSTAAAPPKRQRKRSQKNRQDSVDSDMSDNDINASSAGPKTENEVLPPDVQAPSMVKIPDDMEITRVGQVASVIDTVVVIRAETGGAWRVLDEGTLCCWEDKTVLGNVRTSSTTSDPVLMRVYTDLRDVWIRCPAFLQSTIPLLRRPRSCSLHSRQTSLLLSQARVLHLHAGHPGHQAQRCE